MDIYESIMPCFDHLGGPTGGRLLDRLLELGWVTPEPNAGVTPQGWAGLSALGVNLAPLMGARRKPVALCVESRSGRLHLGGHLGALVRQHFLAQGWMESHDGGLQLTVEGERILRHLGVATEERH